MGTSKRTMINKLHKATRDITSHIYSDSSWEGINKTIDAMKNMMFSIGLINKIPYDVIITVENGGYHMNADGQTWKEYKVSITDESNEEIIGGLITAHACGSIEDNWKNYDISVQLW